MPALVEPSADGAADGSAAMARATVTISLDAELVIEVMVLADIRNAQDAVEAVVRDYVAQAHRTEAVTGDAQGYHRRATDRRDQDTGAT